MMTDQQFLFWIHERLVNVHGERELFDYMHHLRAIILATPKNQTTKNLTCDTNPSEFKKIMERSDAQI